MLQPIKQESFWTDDEIGLLYLLDDVLHSTLDQDNLFFVILTAATAGAGFSFSRAALFLIDREQRILNGMMGVGPSGPEEAHRIWSTMAAEKPTLSETLAGYAKFDPAGAFNQTVLHFSLPLDSDNICNRVLREGETYLLSRPYDNDLFPEILKPFTVGSQFVITPVSEGKKATGLLIGDNAFSDRLITERQVQMLAFFAERAGSIMELVRMNQQLTGQLAELQDAYRSLYETRHRLLRSEHLAGIGQSLSGIGHEIREPLAVIGGLARIISRNPAGNQEIRKQSQIIYQKTCRLARFINRSLAFASLAEPKVEKCELGSLIAEVCAEVAAAMQEEGSPAIDIRQNPRPERLEIMADQEQLKHVLTNLIENSRHSIEGLPNGIISVDTERDTDFVRIRISDNGVGISKSDLDRVFEPFFTTRSGGTGLGLAFARQLTEFFGGKITAESEGIGKGARFTIQLPFRPAPQKTVSAESTP